MSLNTDLPAGFLEHMRPFFTDEEEFGVFQTSCLTPLRKSIRVNTLKISVPDFCAHARQKDWKLTSIPWCREGFWIDRPEEEKAQIPLGKTWEHVLGLIYIQEASSMLPPIALLSSKVERHHFKKENEECNSKAKEEICDADQKTREISTAQISNSLDTFRLPHKSQDVPSFKLLDMAAAPGSKTTQLSANMNGNGLLMANEFSASRIKKLYSNLERSGVCNVVLANYDGEKFGRYAPHTFDAILLDAPCTGEGTVRKDRTALRNWSERKIQIAAGVQKKLIVSAFNALKLGGTLVYSTCTLSRTENEEVCGFLLEQFGDEVECMPLTDLFEGAEKCVTPEGFLRVLPHVFDSEGFFVAKIRKRGEEISAEHPPHRKHVAGKKRKFPFSPIHKKQLAMVGQYYEEHFGFSFPFSPDRVWERERAVWLFPEGTEDLIGTLRFDRAGIKLCEVHDKGIKTFHEMAVVFGDQFSRNVLELRPSEARNFLAGRDIVCPSSSEHVGEDFSELSSVQKKGNGVGEVLLRFRGFPMGIGKWQKGRIKNQLPRSVVKEGVGV